MLESYGWKAVGIEFSVIITGENGKLTEYKDVIRRKLDLWRVFQGLVDIEFNECLGTIDEKLLA